MNDMSPNVQSARSADRAMLDRALGGRRGIIDSGVPTAVFVTVLMLTGQSLRPALLASVASGVAIALWRAIRREPLQQVLAGFVGVAISAIISGRTGRASDYFLMGIVINAAYGGAYLVSILVRWPLIGLLVGSIRGDPRGWRKNRQEYAAYVTTSWLWVAMFAVRLAVQIPLYLISAVGALGATKLLLGWPLFLLTGWLSYRILNPVLTLADSDQDRSGAESNSSIADS